MFEGCSLQQNDGANPRLKLDNERTWYLHVHLVVQQDPRVPLDQDFLVHPAVKRSTFLKESS